MSRQIDLVSEDLSDDEQGNNAPAKQKKPVLPKHEYTEVECRYQLTQLNHPSKWPPTVMTEDIFSTACKLGRDGVNPHKLRMEKDVSLADVEALFGQEKDRNGFLLAERLPPSLRKEVESLYCQCYQKPHPTTHIGKELAMGWTLQSKGHQVNWAGFAAETNLDQRRSYARRAKLWLTRLAEILQLPLHEVAQREGFTKYLEVKDEKPRGVQLFCDMQQEGHGSGETKTSVQRVVRHSGGVQFSDAIYDPCRPHSLMIFFCTPVYFQCSVVFQSVLCCIFSNTL
jgi:hypothetical protein